MDLNNSSEVIAAPDEYLSTVIVNLFIGIHIFIHYFFALPMRKIVWYC